MRNVCLILVAVLSLWGCQRSAAPPNNFDRADAVMGTYVSAHTSGEISRTSNIRVVFAKPVIKSSQIGVEVDRAALQVRPAIPGVLVWTDTRTLELKPSDFPKSGVHYQARLDLNHFINGLPISLHRMDFGFRTKDRALRLNLGHLKSAGDSDMVTQTLSGVIESTDYETDADIEKRFEAAIGSINPSIDWSHDDSGMSHRFTITQINRGDQDQQLNLRWDGGDLDPQFKGHQRILVPARDSFVFLNGRAEDEPRQHVVLTFSDPLSDQDLTGLIRMPRAKLNFVVEGNQIRAYPQSRLQGLVTVRIESGILNSVGRRIETANRLQLNFFEEKPALRLSETKVICPSTDGVIFPFEAVNLHAVDVRVTRIHQDNIQQFFQVNHIDGQYEMHRVGSEVLRTTVKLERADVDLKQWNRHVLELGKLLETQPGAIYQVQIGFRQAYSLYGGCNPVTETGPSMWDQPYPSGSWENRENPCRQEYFNIGRAVQRNLLAGDLGLIAKQDQDGSWLFVATDLVTTQPLAGLNLKVHSYQQELLQELTTDADGMARCEPKGAPYLVTASSGDMRGYLTLNGRNLLSNSMFRVGGRQLQVGLNGFIYGERGVWRPGDDIHLTFVLFDRDDFLPGDHPVNLEWFDPQNRLVERKTAEHGVNGFYPFKLKTHSNAPTGFYQVRVSVGGAIFSKRLRVETIQPNRLKIKFDVDDTDQDANLQANLSAAWLHGAVAGELKTTVSMRMRKTQASFDEFPNYEFNDATLNLSDQTREIYNGKLDEEGNRTFPITLDKSRTLPAKLRLTFSCKIFEPGGAFSTDRFSITRLPHKTYVGLRTPPTRDWPKTLDTDKDHWVDVITVDRAGSPVARDGLEVSVYKLEWRWWWHRNAWSAGDFQRRHVNNMISTTTLSTDQNGHAAYTLNVPRDEWGRYLIRVVDQDGHSSSRVVFMDWPNWRGRGGDPGEGAAMLTFSADKPTYTTGDTVTLNIPTGAEGRALVSLESGSRVIETHWVEVQEGFSRFSFTARPEMAPNIYAAVTLLQPHAQTANNLPIRLYGVIPITVKNPDTVLAPKLSMPDVLEPESNFEIKVSESEGKAMTYTVAMVDEGLLDLTRFKTPDPLTWFYSKQALQIRTHDLYNQVAGSYGGQLETLLSIGGDGSGGPTDTPKANRFKPVVRFIGPFHLKPGETASHQLDMPNYVGSVRTMVVAGNQKAFGHTDQTTPVRKPLMLLGTLPRVLGPGERVNLPVSVFAMEAGLGDITVTMTANDLLKPLDGTQRKLRLNEAGDSLVSFPLEVADHIGIARVTVTAMAGESRARFQVELDVRNPNPLVSDFVNTELQPGETWSHEFEALGSIGSNTALLEVSGIPSMNLESRLNYLTRYPHGCLEQTVSAVFPQLYLTDLVEMDAERAARIEDNIRAGLKRLQQFQRYDGSLSYWPGANRTQPWATNYAGHFMLEAERLGYRTPGDLLLNWLNYQKRSAAHWNRSYNQDTLVQAHRLYLLALAGKSEIGAMNRYRERKQPTNVERLLLAAAYDLAGQPEAATELAAGIGLTVRNYRELSNTFGSGARDRALMLVALLDMGRTSDALAMARDLAKSFAGNGWYNTQALGYGLSVLGRLNSGGKGPMSYRYQLDPTLNHNVATDKSLSNRELDISETQPNRLVVENTGDRPLFLRLVRRGRPAVVTPAAMNANLNMHHAYFKADGSRLDPRNLIQGQDFYVDVTLTNPGNRGEYRELALTRIFPSGWEILNQRMDEALKGTGARPVYENVRDDRVMTYFNLNPNQSATWRVWLNATYAGRFYMPAIVGEAMYDNEIQAVIPGFWVEVAP